MTSIGKYASYNNGIKTKNTLLVIGKSWCYDIISHTAKCLLSAKLSDVKYSVQYCSSNEYWNENIVLIV